jgi:multicomponent Na+:H+ antiporter subunit F
MSAVLSAAAVAVLVVMALALLRALLGPTTWDRILAVNMFGTKTVLFIALLGAISGRGDYLDVALVYAMINFLAVVAVLRLSEAGRLERPARQRGGR